MKPSLALSYGMKKKVSPQADGPMPSSHNSEACPDCNSPDRVSRIMHSKALRSGRAMSEGGEVANGGEDALESLADGQPNEFDDLALRDDLSSHETAANSGDELGDKRESDDRDMVKRIMSKRAKSRMPSPK